MGTFLGGTNADFANAVVVDAAGNSYVAGGTVSPDFPTTPGAFDTTYDGPEEIGDAFVAKFDPTGALIFSTFLGGRSWDEASSIAVDSLGNAYVAGTTWSSDFPTTKGAYDRKGPTGPWWSPHNRADAFVVKFDPTGRVVYSTFLGGQEEDWGFTIAVDASGNAYVAGETGAVWSDSPSSFPITPGVFSATGGGRGDVFVAKLNPEGTDLIYSTVIGGSAEDAAGPIALDAMNNVYLAGQTWSPDLPVTPDAFDTTFNLAWPEEWGWCCPYDAFLFKLSSDASALAFSTFLGADLCTEEPMDIAVDSVGSVHVAGWRGCLESSTPGVTFDLSCQIGPFFPQCSPDAILVGFDPTGELLYGAFLPAVARSMDLDESGNFYLTGDTYSYEDFPTTPGAYDSTHNGGGDAFVAKLDGREKTLLYSTFLGGGDQVLLEPPEPGLISYTDDVGFSIAFDPSGNVTVAGATGSNDFPVTEGAYDSTYNGRADAFIIRLEPIPEPNRAPFAYFEVDAKEDDPRVSVDASNSADAEDGDELLEVRWDWESDGVWDTAWSTGKMASHEYAAPGTYVIRLEVRDTSGLSASTTREVNVVTAVTPLGLNLFAEPMTGTVPLTVSFSASPSGGVPPYSFSWDLGDGNSTAFQNPTHTYGVAGTYAVVLTVTDADGRTVTRTIQITATKVGPPVTGAGVPPEAVYAIMAAVAGGIGGLAFWRWRKRARTPPSPPHSA